MNHTKMESITAKIMSPKRTAKWLEPWKIKMGKNAESWGSSILQELSDEEKQFGSQHRFTKAIQNTSTS